MARKVLKFNLSVSSVDNLISEVSAISSNLQAKVVRLIDALTEIGFEQANEITEKVAGPMFADEFDDAKSDRTSVITDGNGKYIARVMVNSKKALFIEFGAGIYYSEPQNPLADELGYGLGTYPGQTQAYNPNGWWYSEEGTGKSKHSYGNPAWGPIYHAGSRITQEVDSIVKQIFSGGI